MTENVHRDNGVLSRQDREKLIGHKSKVIWFTGLSGCGKSTLAYAVQQELHSQGILCYKLDGDNVKFGLNGDLGFSPEDRTENIRRTGEVTKLMYDSGGVVLASFISPYQRDRDFVRELIGEDFVEVYVRCSLEECEKRDVKGLYAKARAGLIKDFTGISAPYEEPQNPEIVVDTERHDIETCVQRVIEQISLT